jgi:lysophospholipase L1-like esterase
MWVINIITVLKKLLIFYTGGFMKNKTRNRFIAFALVFTVLTTFTPFIVNAAPLPVKYAALGDSVPAGDALPSPEDGNYAALLSAAMTQVGYEVNFHNVSVSGQATAGLLAELTTPGSRTMAAVAGADIVTVNIGGNNVLYPMIGFFNEFMSGLGITDIAAANPMQLAGLVGALAGYTLTAEQIGILEAGVAGFAADFPQIIAAVRALAPGSVVIVSTIFNPIPAELAMYDAAELIVGALNEIITAGDGIFYIVADTYAAFSAAGAPVTNVNINPLANPLAGAVSFDIHPNAAGHALMAEIHAALVPTPEEVLAREAAIRTALETAAREAAEQAVLEAREAAEQAALEAREAAIEQALAEAGNNQTVIRPNPQTNGGCTACTYTMWTPFFAAAFLTAVFLGVRKLKRN